MVVEVKLIKGNVYQLTLNKDSDIEYHLFLVLVKKSDEYKKYSSKFPLLNIYFLLVGFHMV